MKTLVALISILLAVIFLLAGCQSISVGDKLTAKHSVDLVENWNAPVNPKPIACTLSKGETVEVVEISTLSLGSSEKETIIRVSSIDGDCEGWGFPRDFDQ